MERKLKKYEIDVEDIYTFSCMKVHMPAGTTYSLHWHDFIEFEIILSGEARHLCNEQEDFLSRGNAYIMHYYDFHEIHALTDVELYSIHFDPNLLHPKMRKFFSYYSFHHKFDEEETLKIIETIDQINEETKSTDELRDVFINSLVNQLVATMIRKCSSGTAQTTPLLIQQTIAYLDEHLSEKITLEKVAKELSFSANYIGKMFKSQMKCSFNEYLNTLRLKRACDLLHSTNMSIKEIAAAAGYHSIEYFMYVFKRKMLMTPGEYRNLKI